MDDEQTSAYALLQRGRSLLAGGQPRAAVEALEAAAAEAPGSTAVQEELGRALFATAQVRRARDAFEQLLESDPSNAWAHFAVGRCWEREGHLTEAVKHFKLAVALGNDPEYRLSLSRVAARLDA